MKEPTYIFLASGFEEIEAVFTIDFLRRLNFNIITVGINGLTVKGAHNISVQCDITIKEIQDKSINIILPGGMPGTINLSNDEKIISLIQNSFKDGKLIAAICAAPLVLYKAQILTNKFHTAHPSVKDSFNNTKYIDAKAISDNNIITAKSAGTVLDFCIEISNFFNRRSDAIQLAKSIYIIE